MHSQTVTWRWRPGPLWDKTFLGATYLKTQCNANALGTSSPVVRVKGYKLCEIGEAIDDDEDESIFGFYIWQWAQYIYGE